MASKKREEFGVFLREIRLAAGLSQGDVAKFLKWTTPQFVSNIERGIALPPVSALKKIAHLYKVSADDLYQHMEEATIEDITAQLKRKFQATKGFNRIS